MNRKKGQSVIFPSEAFSIAFLKCFEENHAQLGKEKEIRIEIQKAINVLSQDLTPLPTRVSSATRCPGTQEGAKLYETLRLY